MRNPTGIFNNQQLGTGFLIALVLMYLVWDSPLPGSVQNVLYAMSLLAGMLFVFWDIIVGPKRMLLILTMLGVPDETKAVALSAWCSQLHSRLTMGQSVHAELIWLEQYLSKNISTTMSRGTLTCVERLCKSALDLKREDPGLCLSIYQMVLSKTNRNSEITGLWMRYASVPGVSSVFDTLH